MYRTGVPCHHHTQAGNTMEGEQLQRLNTLEEWLQKTCITLTQVNGQRKYGGPPPGWCVPAPGPGCEVFISQIPRDVYEDRLIPLFQSVGTLYEFRLMMNFSGQNRGFAYAKYGDQATASTAVFTLNQYCLAEGARLTVRRSTEKRKLCLGDLPANMSEPELLMVLRMVSEGVDDVMLKVGGPKGREVEAIVLYSSHYAGSMAKKILVQAFKKQYGICITVKWLSTKSKHVEKAKPDNGPLTPPGLNPLPKPFITSPHLHPPPSLDNVPTHTAPQPLIRAVGHPTIQPRDGLVSQDAASQLKWFCEVNELGAPQYEVRYINTGLDGFLNFAYKVLIPAFPTPLSGFVQILPGSSTHALKGEIHWAITEHVLKTIRKGSNQLAF